MAQRLADLAGQLGVEPGALVDLLDEAERRALAPGAALSDATAARLRTRVERARRRGAGGMHPARSRRASPAPRPPRPPRRSGGYLAVALPVADPAAVQRIVCENLLALPAYALEWDGRELTAVWHRKRTPKRTPEVEEYIREAKLNGTGVSRAAAEGYVFGTAMSAELTRAAGDLGVSYSTLYRLVRGQIRTVSWRLAFRLERKLRATNRTHIWTELERGLLTPAARRASREYVAYVDREIARLRARRAPKHDVYFTNAETKAMKRIDREITALGAIAPRGELARLRVCDAWNGWKRLHASLSGTERLRLVKRAALTECELIRREMAVFRAAVVGANRSRRRTG